HQVLSDPAYRHATPHGLTVPVDGVEAGHLHGLRAVIAVGPCDAQRRYHDTQVEVPLADAVFAEAESQRSVWDDNLVGDFVDQSGFERRIVDLLTDIRRGQELSRHQRVAPFFQFDQEGQVGVAANVVGEK